MKKTSFGRSFFCLGVTLRQLCKPNQSVGAGLPAIAHCRPPAVSLTHRHRGQARSYRRSPLRYRLVFALLFISASASAAPPTLEPLLNSIAERLEIADQVALSKWP